MHQRPDHTAGDNPLRHLTAAQFMALGGNAVVYVRPIKGKKLTEMIDEAELEAGGEEDEFQLVVSADGQPLLVADSTEAVEDWLADKSYGIVALH